MIMIRISKAISPQTWYNQAREQALPDLLATQFVIASIPSGTADRFSDDLVTTWKTAHRLLLCVPSDLPTIRAKIQSP
jgi:hypothetical protein